MFAKEYFAVVIKEEQLKKLIEIDIVTLIPLIHLNIYYIFLYSE